MVLCKVLFPRFSAFVIAHFLPLFLHPARTLHNLPLPAFPCTLIEPTNIRADVLD